MLSFSLLFEQQNQFNQYPSLNGTKGLQQNKQKTLSGSDMLMQGAQKGTQQAAQRFTNFSASAGVRNKMLTQQYVNKPISTPSKQPINPTLMSSHI